MQYTSHRQVLDWAKNADAEVTYQFTLFIDKCPFVYIRGKMIIFFTKTGVTELIGGGLLYFYLSYFL